MAFPAMYSRDGVSPKGSLEDVGVVPVSIRESASYGLGSDTDKDLLLLSGDDWGGKSVIRPGPCYDCRESITCCGRNFGDWDQALVYTTQKRVQLRHRHLGLLYYTLTLGVLVYVVLLDVVLNKGYQAQFALGTASQLLVTPAKPEDVTQLIPTLPYCNFTNATCIAPAPSDVTAPPDPTPETVFITSHVITENYAIGSCDWRLDPSCPMPHPTNETVLFAGIESAKVHLSQVVVSVGGKAEGMDWSMDGKLVDACDATKVLRHLPTSNASKGEAVAEFTLLELLNAADESACGGPPVSLDRDGVRNHGFRVVLKVTLAKDQSEADLHYTLRIHAVPQQDITQDTPSSNCIAPGANCTIQRRAGVVLTVSAGGTVGKFDMMTLLIRLTAGWALLGLAVSVTDFCAVWVFRCKISRGGGWCPCCTCCQGKDKSPPKKDGEADTWNNVYFRYMYDPSQDLGDVLHRNKRDLRKEELEEWEELSREAGQTFGPRQRAMLNALSMRMEKMERNVVSLHRTTTSNQVNAGSGWGGAPVGGTRQTPTQPSLMPHTQVPDASVVKQGGGTPTSLRERGGGKPPVAKGTVRVSVPEAGGQRASLDPTFLTSRAFGKMEETTRVGHDFDDDEVDEDSRR
eukprot:Hpha_TRINITY_DN15424_c1_g1::TRINITY_DN15424_c1_g1_i1::g.173114::m.173114